MKFDCERCYKAFAAVVLNGYLWLCWDCYCKQMSESSVQGATK